MQRLSEILKGVTESDDGEDLCPVTGEPHACEARDESDGGACEGCEGPDEEDAEDDEDMGDDEGNEGEGDGEEADESRRTWVAKLIEAAGKKPSKGQKLKAKYMQDGHFKGKKGSGERFKSCTKYMAAKGDVKDPKALCGKIARRKAMGEAVVLSPHDQQERKSLQDQAAKALKPTTLLMQMVPALAERFPEISTDYTYGIRQANRALELLFESLTALKAGKAFKQITQEEGK